MPSFNKVILLGNLTRDPETRTTENGTTVAHFGLAVNRIFHDREGNQREEVLFIDIDAFARSAENIKKILPKRNKFNGRRSPKAPTMDQPRRPIPPKNIRHPGKLPIHAPPKFPKLKFLNP